MDKIQELIAKQIQETTSHNKNIIRICHNLELTFEKTLPALIQKEIEKLPASMLQLEVIQIDLEYSVFNFISTHLCDVIDSENIQIVRRLTILPLEIIVRNIATGSFSKRYGIPDDGSINFEPPLIEFCLKDDTLGDPFILPEAAKAIGLLSFKIKSGEIIDIKESTIKSLAFLINFELQDIFKQRGITLVDFKIELGVDENGKVYLADEISPDTCRFWDMKTKKKLDKDVFRQRTGDLIEAYSELLNNLNRGDV